MQRRKPQPARKTAPRQLGDAPAEVRLRIKPATATNLLTLNRALNEAQARVDAIVNRIQDHLRPLYTEAGIEQGRCVEVTETAPHELVVVVVKRTKE